MNEDKQASSAGVEELVARLRDEGVMAARQEAERLIRDAQERADQIVAEAEADAEQQRAQAAREVVAEREAAMAALRLAARDASQSLKQALTNELQAYLRRIVREHMGDVSFLRELILAVVATASDGLAAADRPRRIALGTGFIEGQDPEVAEATRGMLLALSRDMLAQGVELIQDPDLPVGARLSLKDGEGVLELTDAALAGVLGKHLIPRFAAILDGEA